MRTDEERLNFLQKLTDSGHIRKVILRNSTKGRGCVDGNKLFNICKNISTRDD